MDIVQQKLATHARAIRALGKNVMRDVIEIGRHLTEAKAACPHGQWLPWLEKEFAWGETQARRYMQVHAQFGKSSNLADLGPLDVSALYLLAAPSTPAGIRDQALKRAAHGESLTHAEIKKLIADAAEPPAPPQRAPKEVKVVFSRAERSEIPTAIKVEKPDEVAEAPALLGAHSPGRYFEHQQFLLKLESTADAVDTSTPDNLAYVREQLIAHPDRARKIANAFRKIGELGEECAPKLPP